MKRARKVVAIMLLTTTLIFVETRQAAAQDDQPDFRMLMNLDLFASPPSELKGAPETKDAPAPGSDDSMLEQIRALSAMGYLGDNPDSARTAGPGNAAGDRAPAGPSIEGIEGHQQ